jgi:hypothetical protein
LNPGTGCAKIFMVAGAFAGYQIAANAAFVVAVPAERRGQAFGLANGGMQVFQGTWFIVAGAIAGALGPATMIAISGRIGAVIATVLAVRWRASWRPGMTSGKYRSGPFGAHRMLLP